MIIEPVAGNMGCIPPAEGFLETLRELATRHGIVLIFDEVVTGYRLAYGGAQEKYGVVPDLCTLGKVIGGGFPLAAITGRGDIMAHFDKTKAGPDGFTYQIGTLSGNPVAAVAGLKTMELLRREGSYDTLRRNGEFVMQALRDSLSQHGIAHQVVGDPVLFDVVFTDSEVNDYRDVTRGNAEQAQTFNKVMRREGILKPDSKFYASIALTEEDLEQTRLAIDIAASSLAS